MISKDKVRISITISKDLLKLITDMCIHFNNTGVSINKSEFITIACFNLLSECSKDTKRQKEEN